MSLSAGLSLIKNRGTPCFKTTGATHNRYTSINPAFMSECAMFTPPHDIISAPGCCFKYNTSRFKLPFASFDCGLLICCNVVENTILGKPQISLAYLLSWVVDTGL